MPPPRGPWETLGLPRGADRAQVRRAYAARLKALPPDDADAFQRLRAAYEAALAQADAASPPRQDDAAPPPRQDDACADGATGIADTSVVDAAAQAGLLDDDDGPPVGLPDSEDAATEPLDRVAERILRLARAGRVDAMLAEAERFAGGLADAAEARRQALEPMLYHAVADDPRVAPEAFEALARRFDWTLADNAVAGWSPGLDARFLARLEAVESVLDLRRFATGEPTSPRWPKRRRGAIVQRAARLLLQPADGGTPLRATHALGLRYVFDWLRPHEPVVLDYFDPQRLREARRRMDGPVGEAAPAWGSAGTWARILAIVAAVAAVRAFTADESPRDAGPDASSGVASMLRDAITPERVPHQVLRQNVDRWVSLDPRPDGVRIVFSQLLFFRGAIDTIRYGVDRDEPDRLLAFEPAPAADAFLPYAGPIAVEAPPGTKFVTVRVRFKDGTVSRVHRYRAPRAG